MNDKGNETSIFTSSSTGRRRPVLGDLRSRVLGAMMLVSLVPMTVVGYQGYHCARQGVVEHVHMHLVSVIEARRALLNEWLKERMSEIETLAALPVVLESVSELASKTDLDTARALVRLLDSVQSNSQSYESLMAYDARWELLATTNERSHEENEILTEAFQFGMKNADDAFLDVTHLHEEGSVGLHIGYRLQTEDDTNLGFLVANLNLSKTLNPLLQERSGLWRTGKVYVISPELDIISEPLSSGDGVALRQKTNPSVLECLSPGGPIVREYVDYLGHEVLGTAMLVPASQWIAVAEMDTEEALEWLDVLLSRLALTFSVTLLFVIFISTAISKFLGRPLKELARIAHRIRIGHEDERLERISGTEAEEVRQAFNLMLDELQENQKEIVRTATLASVGELSASIVHEMRNPLSSVKMNLQALTSVVADDESNLELAQIASEQVVRVEDMLTDLLQYGRPIELRREETTVSELVAAALDVVAQLAKEKGVKIELQDLTEGVPVYVDTEQICRALSNLLINAIQASRDAGNIQLVSRRVSYDGGFVQIDVLDEGSGLTGEAETDAFKPFFSTKPGGTGLGLSIARKVIELHGGEVSASSRPEGGAAFSFTLPLLTLSPV